MNAENVVIPEASINERPDAYELTFALPGVGKGEVDLRVENRSLTLKTHGSESTPVGFRKVAQEFERLNYSVSVDLPERSDPSTLKAKLENGLLRVTVQKRPETQARQIEIG